MNSQGVAYQVRASEALGKRKMSLNYALGLLMYSCKLVL